jgi:two-component system chemotaxis response regulator CheB
MADVPVVHHWGRKRSEPSERGLTLPASGVPVTTLLVRDVDNLPKVEMVAMASSTGGPATLARVLKLLPSTFSMPILIVQHVTRGFTGGLAEWLNAQTAIHVRVPSHGDSPQPGTALIAPDDYHMQVASDGTIELSKEEPYKGLRPSANFLFRSVAKRFGPHAVGIMLTGMGDDGVEGLEDLYFAGGFSMAQDEESCVVYGMPHAAVTRNIVDQVLPPEQIAATLVRLDQRAQLGESVV